VTLVLRIGPEDWGRCRFAVSPLHELAAGLRLLGAPADRGPLPGLPWVEGLGDLDAPEYAPLTTLMPRGGYGVDFLTPPPAGPAEGFADALARVAATDPEQVGVEIARCRREQGLAPDPVAPAERRDALVGLLQRAWDAWRAAHWPRLRDVLDADVARRAARVAGGGLAAVLVDLSPQAHLVDSTITLPGPDAEVDLDGRGLLLMPSGLLSGVGAVWDPPWHPTLLYPATGRALPSDTDPTALRRLLGATRATLLAALDRPATTSGLAVRCGVPLSTASDHLAVLRRSGLVRAVRRGHAVEHTRSALGEALLSASGD
jgi:DNA-binding transcriptional ArsR family regulator